MKVINYLTIFFGVFFLVIEYLRRGVSYYAINASTMIEDSALGILFLAAAFVYRKNKSLGQKLIISSWAYAVGAMLLPFIAHLEAFLRGATFRPDHPHTDVGSIVLKGIIWGICVVVFVMSIKKNTLTDVADSETAA
jgi:hypothetical protein